MMDARVLTASDAKALSNGHIGTCEGKSIATALFMICQTACGGGTSDKIYFNHGRMAAIVGEELSKLGYETSIEYRDEKCGAYLKVNWSEADEPTKEEVE